MMLVVVRPAYLATVQRAGCIPAQRRSARDLVDSVSAIRQWYTSRVKAASLLRYARRLAGLTQRQLAVLAGVPQATVGRIETGQITPRVDTLEKLLRAAGRELNVGARPGIGVDRSQIRELLRLTPGQRLELAARDAAGLGRLQARTTQR